MVITPIELAFTDANGRARVLQAVNVEGYEWRLHASLEGGSFDLECSNWQAVERTRSWLSTHAHERNQSPPEGMAPLA